MTEQEQAILEVRLQELEATTDPVERARQLMRLEAFRQSIWLREQSEPKERNCGDDDDDGCG